MARSAWQSGWTPSLLDRFIDPAFQNEAPVREFSVSEMTDVVRRDLEDLLNTRQSNHRVPPELDEVQRSIVAFGMPDLTSLNALTSQQREEIGRVLERIVELFEPRLRDVKATLIDGAESKMRTLRFRIDARLRMEPAPDVAFETVLELAGGFSSVQRSDK
ncbi:MAG TPA: type VI secretion system baseplate subunit TssE [Gemmataceae bacterium]|nr:type VI secretion system baseplate subunit TssE [Gemmataceae bacterium]